MCVIFDFFEDAKLVELQALNKRFYLGIMPNWLESVPLKPLPSQEIPHEQDSGSARGLPDEIRIIRSGDHVTNFTNYVTAAALVRSQTDQAIEPEALNLSHRFQGPRP